MTLGFSPLYAVRSTGNEYLILFCKILFLSAIAHLQFKDELLSKHKRLRALWQFLKAEETITVQETAIVIGKTIHYMCVTVCGLCTLAYIKYKAGRPMYFDAVSDLQFQKQLINNTL